MKIIMKTIYITETQKKNLAAQDQVSGKVNSSIMRYENIELDKYKIGTEDNSIFNGNSHVIDESADISDIMVNYCFDYYKDENARNIAHGIKNGNIKDIEYAASLMSKYVPNNATLVPIPSRNGKSTTTLLLCNIIKKITGAEVLDILNGKNRDSLYDLKKKGFEANEEFFGYASKKIRGNIILVDNVIDTGWTIRAAANSTGAKRALVFAKVNKSIAENKHRVNDKNETVPDKCPECGGDIVLELHGEPVFLCNKCKKYFGTLPFKVNESITDEIVNPEDVDLKSFTLKKKLNPKFWKDGHLDTRIRLKLLDIADDFIEYLGIDWAEPSDVIMTGSLANYNWDEKYSDIDLHVVVNYSDIDERTDFVDNYFYSQKQLWNQEHSNINIMGFPVEVYVQDENEEHDSSGVYSLYKDKWLIEPDRDALIKSKVNKEYIKNRVSDYMNKIDKLCYLFKKSKEDEYKVRKITEKANTLFKKIKNDRKKGFEESGGREINNLNIVFKSLRRNGYIEKLSDLCNNAYDVQNSINEQ